MNAEGACPSAPLQPHCLTLGSHCYCAAWHLAKKKGLEHARKWHMSRGRDICRSALHTPFADLSSPCLLAAG